MLAEEMIHLRKIFSKEGVVFCYSGYMTENILLSIGSAIKQKLAKNKTDKKVARSVFSVFVEQVQNIIRYSMEKDPAEENEDSGLRYGLLMVGCDSNNNYFVSCGNMVEHKDVDRLTNNLTHIQSLDHEQLKALHKETLRGETPEYSKGAGVGFIDIARHATRGFDFSFTDYSDKYAFFSIKAHI